MPSFYIFDHISDETSLLKIVIRCKSGLQLLFREGLLFNR